MLKRYLLAPGPTPVPPEVLLAMARPMIHHRAPEFDKLFAEVREDLKWLFQTRNDVLILAASGTGGMEGSVSNFLSPGDKALTINGGKFGERWTKLCKAFGAQVTELKVEWGHAIDPQAVADALKTLQPAEVAIGQGHCTFAVNRRDNKEADVPKMLADGIPLKGVVDHDVPVLTVKGKKDNNMLGLLFGYACHPTTLAGNAWNGDYPGFAQINLEAAYPGICAMFFNTCGGDQNPLPRRTIELCQQSGEMLSNAVKEVVAKPMKTLPAILRTDFSIVDLDYEEIVTKEKLEPIASGDNPIHARWAKRMLAKIDQGEVFPTSYPYPVQAWRLGKELLFIGIGGEAVVDYSLRFKKEYNQGTTWVSGYTNDMVAYIPSRRVWEEGGYEGGNHLDEYGRPAWRWAGDIEDRIAGAVKKVVEQVSR